MEDRYHGMTDTICCLFSNYKRKFCGSFCKNVGTSIYFFFPQVPQELCLPPIKNYYQNKLPCDNLEKLNETDTNKCICVSHFLDKPKSDINHHISPFFFFFSTSERNVGLLEPGLPPYKHLSAWQFWSSHEDIQLVQSWCP